MTFLSKLLNIFGCMAILIFMVMLFVVIRVYKGSTLKSIGIMASVSLRSGKVLFFFMGIWLLFCAFFQDSLSSWIPSFPPFYLAGLAMIALGDTCLPPGVVYLGPSNLIGFQFLGSTMFTTAPLKIAHLLDSYGSNVPLHLKEFSFMFGYRVGKGWQDAVRCLCNIAPLIILDTRNITTCVLEEARFILKSENKLKTIFITEEDGSLPANVASHNEFVVLTLPSSAVIAGLTGIGRRSFIRGKKAIKELIETKAIRRSWCMSKEKKEIIVKCESLEKKICDLDSKIDDAIKNSNFAKKIYALREEKMHREVRFQRIIWTVIAIGAVVSFPHWGVWGPIFVLIGGRTFILARMHFFLMSRKLGGSGYIFRSYLSTRLFLFQRPSRMQRFFCYVGALILKVAFLSTVWIVYFAFASILVLVIRNFFVERFWN